jgi:hypothetical protein
MAGAFGYHASSPPRGVLRVAGCPSGQREQTVNLSAMPTEVQILAPPPPRSATGDGQPEQPPWREPAQRASIAQLAEHFHGKEGVFGSNPNGGSIAGVANQGAA